MCITQNWDEALDNIRRTRTKIANVQRKLRDCDFSSTELDEEFHNLSYFLEVEEDVFIIRIRTNDFTAPTGRALSWGAIADIIELPVARIEESLTTDTYVRALFNLLEQRKQNGLLENWPEGLISKARISYIFGVSEEQSENILQLMR